FCAQRRVEIFDRKRHDYSSVQTTSLRILKLPTSWGKPEFVELVHSARRAGEWPIRIAGIRKAHAVHADQNETPLDLIGPSHFLISGARNCARYSGERRSGAITSPPTCLRRCCKDGISKAATVARLSLWMIGCGVFAGRKSAYQLGRSKLVSPCSCAEGKSGRCDDRVLLRIAIGFTVLAAICGFGAAFNHAYAECRVPSDNTWRGRLKPFRNVAVARERYLTVPEAQRLLNAAEGGLRDLVQAALQTGARYRELTRLKVHDFDAASGTVGIAKSKAGRPRRVFLTEEGTVFFHSITIGRGGDELMLRRHS